MGENRPAKDFEAIYREYAHRVLNLVYRLVGDRETARDLTQEIFLKVYRNLDSFRHDSDIFTWIYRIAVNHVTNHLKSRRRWTALLEEEIPGLFKGRRPPFRAAGERGADEELQSRERAAVVWREILELPPKYRVPLVLYHYEGMSYGEIAEAIGVTTSTVEARIYRARRKLAARLRPWLGKI